MDLKDKYLAIEKGIINIGFVPMCKNSPDNSWSSKTYCFLSGYNLFAIYFEYSKTFIYHRQISFESQFPDIKTIIYDSFCRSGDFLLALLDESRILSVIENKNNEYKSRLYENLTYYNNYYNGVIDNINNTPMYQLGGNVENK